MQMIFAKKYEFEVKGNQGYILKKKLLNPVAMYRLNGKFKKCEKIIDNISVSIMTLSLKC